MTWAHQSFAASIVVNDFGQSRYGVVRYKSGRVGYRDYGRSLKNGRGLTFMELMQRKLAEATNFKPLFS